MPSSNKQPARVTYETSGEIWTEKIYLEEYDPETAAQALHDKLGIPKDAFEVVGIEIMFDAE